MDSGHDTATCGGSGFCPECSQGAMAEAFRGAAGRPAEVTCPHCGHSFDPDAPVRTTEASDSAKAQEAQVTGQPAAEAMVNGAMSFEDISNAVASAIRARIAAQEGGKYSWAYVVDLTDTDVVYACGGDDLMQCAYAIDDAGKVTLGDPSSVVRTYAPTAKSVEDAASEAVTESPDRIAGRVMEAKGKDASGARIFRVRLIAYGDSKNGRRYPESVMTSAVPIYEGARAYDHHRTEAELRSSTIAGLIGTYRSVEAEGDGLYADLYLLPSATHAAEALDASLEAQEAGLDPLVGVSHDVMAKYKPIIAGGRRMQEATAIVKVNSADLVADPAAGGKATRMVAGGTDPGTLPENEEDDVPPTKDDILGALAEATDEELAGVGLARAVEAEQDVEQVIEATEIATPKTSWMAKAMIRQKVEDAGLPVAVVESLTTELPERITEADVDNRIATIKHMSAVFERAGLAPTVGRVQVTQESQDKKTKALDAFFAGDFQEGYTSFRAAWQDFTGHQPRAWDADVNKVILRESQGVYDSGDRMHTREGELRLRESMTASSWNLVLGDSITRRMVAEYSRPSLAAWRQVVSSIVPLADFRTQRIDRVGGYGTLPTVNEGAPYQPLASPTNEESTYAPDTRGGTEDITRRMILNDDVRAISNIPKKLGLAAAQTLFRFVFDFFTTNAATSYDSTALFHTNHGNTSTSALSQSALTAVRVAMRQQAGYGDTKDILSIVPVQLVVPSALEELAWQLATSAVAMPSGAPTGAASDIPNIHSRMREPIVIDYYTDANDWFAVADMSMVPGIEIGFIGGRQDPELFTQADPNVGSMFDSDKLTYKIRHEYGGTATDHRGYYRNTL